MKLVSFSEPQNQTEIRPGLLWGKWIIDLEDLPSLAKQLEIKGSQKIATLSRIGSLLKLVTSGPKALENLQDFSWRIFNRINPEKIPQTLRNLSDLKLHTPIPQPPVVRDFYAFEAHVKATRERRGLQMPEEWYEFPAFYYSNPGRIYGPDENVPRPSFTKALDYELEICCVLGDSGRDLSQNEAGSYIAGYTIMNDWSARDIQVKEMKIGLGPAKAKDFATSLGPWIVTPDELQDKRVGKDRFELSMRARVNGKQLSSGNTKDMHWTFPQMISRASEDVEVHAGEFFGSGTVGTGSILELGEETSPWLQPGDSVELEIERLGVLRNRIIQSSKSNRTNAKLPAPRTTSP